MALPSPGWNMRRDAHTDRVLESFSRKKDQFSQWLGRLNQPLPAELSLTLRHDRRLTPRNPRKDVLFDPPPGP
jgi:hypothetical protein